MASKKTAFSTFTVESLLASDRNMGKTLRHENEEISNSPEKDFNLAQEFCPGKYCLYLNF